MHSLRRFRPSPWVIVVLAALLFVVAVHRIRIQQALHLTAIPEWSCDAPAIDASSPTGLAGGTRRLVAPTHDPRSPEWIVQTQELLHGGPWRVRTVDDDNAPAGRPTHATLPYRLGLATLAWVDHRITGQPAGLAVERAALIIDPLLHTLIVLAAGLFAGRRLGGLAGAVVALGAATWFPAAGQFLAGAPSAEGLAWGCALASLLLLAAGWEALSRGAHGSRWFAASGVCGGLGTWVDAVVVSPVILGTAVGAVVVAAGVGLDRRRMRAGTAATTPPLPWRAWALGGGITSLAAWMIEYGVRPVGLDVVALHPLLGVAWLGLGEVLTRVARAGAQQRIFPGWRDATFAIAGVLAVAALPAALLLSGEDSLWTRDPLSGQLSRLRFGGVEANLAAWMRANGFGAGLWAMLLPLAFATIHGLLRNPDGLARSPAPRCGLVVLAAAAAATVTWACLQGRAWSAVDAVMLALAAILASRAIPRSRTTHAAMLAATAAASLAGAIVLWPDRTATDQSQLPRAQVTRLLERDLAHWLRLRAGTAPVTVLAPPATTVTLAYHGGLRGVCSLDPENKDGFAAAVRIVAATTFEEARTLIERRGITHLVFPSWDATLDRYAGFGLGAGADAGTLERAFIVRLSRGVLPDWLRPVPQQLPHIPGLERQAVAVFEVVDEQEHAEALSRLAECYVELEEPARAAPLLETLRQFPADIGVRAALVRVAAARGDREALGRELDGIRTLLASGADEYMSWDRRLSLAIVLAQAKQTEAARAQLQRCLAEADESSLRAATPGELFRLLTLARRFDLSFADESLTPLALQLLPPDFRKKL